MSENSASIKISLSEGEFEIKGSELFVTQQIENFKELITNSLKNQTLNKVDNISSELKKQETNFKPSLEKPKEDKLVVSDKYSNVLHIEDGSVNIIKNLPNKSNQSATIMVAIVLCYANKLAGREETTYNEVAEECKRQACYDGKNFSTYLKGTKPYLIIKGTTRSDKILKLTMPGIEKAKEILEQLNAN